MANTFIFTHQDTAQPSPIQKIFNSALIPLKDDEVIIIECEGIIIVMSLLSITVEKF